MRFLLASAVALLGSTASAADVTLCFPAIGMQGPLAAIILDITFEEVAETRGLLVVSGDGGWWWDKSCGYAYHAACFAPYDVTPALAANNAVGAPLQAFNLEGVGVVAVATWPNWATANGDLEARWLRVSLAAQNLLANNPFFTYGALYYHDEPFSAAEIAGGPYSATSGTVDRAAPLSAPDQAICDAYYALSADPNAVIPLPPAIIPAPLPGVPVAVPGAPALPVAPVAPVPEVVAPGAPAAPAVPEVVAPGAPAAPAVPEVVAPGTPAAPVVVAPGTPAAPVVVVPGAPAVPVVVVPGAPAVPEAPVGEIAIPALPLSPPAAAINATASATATATPSASALPRALEQSSAQGRVLTLVAAAIAALAAATAALC